MFLRLSGKSLLILESTPECSEGSSQLETHRENVSGGRNGHSRAGEKAAVTGKEREGEVEGEGLVGQIGVHVSLLSYNEDCGCFSTCGGQLLEDFQQGIL